MVCPDAYVVSCDGSPPATGLRDRTAQNTLATPHSCLLADVCIRPLENVKSTYRSLPTDQIAFDEENPRIKVALEKYGTKLDEQRIRFALRTATEGSYATSSYRSLKDSVRASRGISVPIVVSPDTGRYICVDGNTRLAIYKELHDEEAPGNWTTINCLVLDDPSPNDIETIRVTAHLVGAREWPAYEKARYLHYLRNVEFMDYDELIARCGGNKAKITRQIDAFHDMNEFYRDVSSDDAFKVGPFQRFRRTAEAEH